MIAVQENNQAEAQAQYVALLEFPGGIMPDGLSQIGHILGLLAHTMDEYDKAVEHFEDALTFCRKGYRPELAWTLCDYADTLLQRDAPGDRQKAMALLDESLAISSELGMKPLMERVLSRRQTLGA